MGVLLVSDVIKHLTNYMKDFGDVPCFIANDESEHAMHPVLSTFVVEVSKEDQEALTSMNAVCIANFMFIDLPSNP